MNVQLLAGVAICDYTNQVPHVSVDVLNTVKLLILSHLNKMSTAENCAASLMQLVGNTKPFERLQRIVKLSECNEPLPEISETESKTMSIGTGRRRSTLWTESEDERLLAGIYKYGTGDWGSISKFFGPRRTRAQCSQRWIRGLNPMISKEKWTHEQDIMLLMLVGMYGEKNWTVISQYMANRCDVQCRYRYKVLEKMQNFAEMKQEAEKKAKQYNSEVKRRSDKMAQLRDQAKLYTQLSMPVMPMNMYPPATQSVSQMYTPVQCLPAAKKARKDPAKRKVVMREQQKSEQTEKREEDNSLIQFDESLMGVSAEPFV